MSWSTSEYLQRSLRISPAQANLAAGSTVQRYHDNNRNSSIRSVISWSSFRMPGMDLLYSYISNQSGRRRGGSNCVSLVGSKKNRAQTLEKGKEERRKRERRAREGRQQREKRKTGEGRGKEVSSSLLLPSLFSWSGLYSRRRSGRESERRNVRKKLN